MMSNDITVISDDCWGGEIYKLTHSQAHTPTVGLGILGDDYFEFLKNLRQPDFTEFLPGKYYKTYPIAENRYAKIHFLHYHSREVAERVFKRKYHGIFWDRIYYKIDLEKPCFTARHIKMWNDMALPNSIALYSDRTRKLFNGPIHNGLYCKEYTLDGSAMFNISCRYFNVYRWIRTGEIHNTSSFQLANFLILDPKAMQRIKNRVLRGRRKN